MDTSIKTPRRPPQEREGGHGGARIVLVRHSHAGAGSRGISSCIGRNGLQGMRAGAPFWTRGSGLERKGERNRAAVPRRRAMIVLAKGGELGARGIHAGARKHVSEIPTGGAAAWRRAAEDQDLFFAERRRGRYMIRRVTTATAASATGMYSRISMINPSPRCCAAQPTGLATGCRTAWRAKTARGGRWP